MFTIYAGIDKPTCQKVANYIEDQEDVNEISDNISSRAWGINTW